MRPILNRMDHTNALWCTLEGTSCFREETFPCQGAKSGRTIFLQSVSGTVGASKSLAVARERHVQVDAGYRIIGEGAWHNCQHLQIVHLDSTVISLQTRVFSRC